MAVATAPIDSPIGVIEPGQVAGRRFHWEALVEDTVVVQIAVNWLMGSENLDPPWSFGPAGERYEIEVRGSPDTCVTIKGWQPQTVAAGEEQPRDRGNRGALRQRDPGNSICPGGDPELFRPAAHHRPGRSRAGTLELLAASPAGMSRIGRVIQWQSLSSSSNRERFRCNPRMRSVARWRQRCR